MSACRGEARPARRRRPVRLGRSPVLLVLLVCLAALGGCTVRVNSTAEPTAQPSSIVRDGRLTLDLTRRPTRADLGMPADDNVRFYDRSAGGPELQLTLRLPTGTLQLPAVGVQAATDSSGGAVDRNYAHDPKFFRVTRRFADADALRAALTAEQPTLGLDAEELDRVLPQIGTGGTVPQQRVLNGLVDDWLSLWVTVSDGDDGVVFADYELQVDYFHSPALDAVVKDGVFAADLTRPPTRAQLGIPDGYADGLAQPAWGTTLGIRLTLPTGTLQGEVRSVRSTSSAGTQVDQLGTDPPRTTVVTLRLDGAEQARSRLAVDAPLLGLDPAAVAALFAGPVDGPRAKATLNGRSTDVYDVTATIDIGRSATTAGSAAVSYTFRYR